mgnify:CR=1 FL=1
MKVQIKTRKLNKEEKKEFGVFISHSNDNDLFKTVCKAFEEAEIDYLVDKQIEIASLDFASEIKKLIYKCKCAVVVITEGALKSSWVNFEIGMLAGKDKKIFLYDPNHLLDKQETYHMEDFPVFDEIRDIIVAINGINYFSNLLQNYTETLTEELYKQRVSVYVEPIKLIVKIPGLEELELDDFHFSVLISTFGSYCGKYGKDNFCFQNFEETNKCPISNYPCALNNAPDIDNFPECVVLNTTMEDELINKDEINIIVPLHKINGTCFKIYAELTDSKQTDRLYALLDELGLMPGCAKSGDANRIYFSLPDSTWNGVFRLKDIFSNNFLCPGILASEDE